MWCVETGKDGRWCIVVLRCVANEKRETRSLDRLCLKSPTLSTWRHRIQCSALFITYIRIVPFAKFPISSDLTTRRDDDVTIWNVIIIIPSCCRYVHFGFPLSSGAEETDLIFVKCQAKKGVLSYADFIGPLY